MFENDPPWFFFAKGSRGTLKREILQNNQTDLLRSGLFEFYLLKPNISSTQCGQETQMPIENTLIHYISIYRTIRLN